MKSTLIFLSFLLFSLTLCVFVNKKLSINNYSNIKNTDKIKKPGDINKYEKINFLTFKSIKPIQNELGIVLGDIESHMPNNHIYVANNKVTWAHETTHGINSVLRNKHSKIDTIFKTATETRPVYGGGSVNAFYVLKDRYIVLKEPDIKISDVANKIPQSLRGRSYDLYLITQQKDWNDYPLYIFDEWSAYTNGAACHLDLKIDDRSDSILSMFNFNIYSICVAMTVKEQDKNYDDKELKAFLRWNIERSFEYLNNDSLSKEYLEKIKKSDDAQKFRTFCVNYFGPKWTKKYFNF